MNSTTLPNLHHRPEGSWTTQQAALYLKLGPRTIQGYARTGSLPATKIRGRWYYDPEKATRWANSLGRETLPQMLHRTNQFLRSRGLMPEGDDEPIPYLFHAK